MHKRASIRTCAREKKETECQVTLPAKFEKMHFLSFSCNGHVLWPPFFTELRMTACQKSSDLPFLYLGRPRNEKHRFTDSDPGILTAGHMTFFFFVSYDFR